MKAPGLRPSIVQGCGRGDVVQLSGLDFIPFTMGIILRFPDVLDAPQLRSSLAAALSDCQPLAGRLRGRLKGTIQLDCCNAGVPFEVAALEDETQLASAPKLLLRSHLSRGVGALMPDIAPPARLLGGEAPVMAVKVTYVGRRSTVLAVAWSHFVADGWSIKLFLNRWTEYYNGDPRAPHVFRYDRSAILDFGTLESAREPTAPRWFGRPNARRALSCLYRCLRSDIVEFEVPGSEIFGAGGTRPPALRETLASVSAYLLSSFETSPSSPGVPEPLSVVLDLRGRVPGIGPSYFGNATLTAPACMRRIRARCGAPETADTLAEALALLPEKIAFLNTLQQRGLRHEYAGWTEWQSVLNLLPSVSSRANFGGCKPEVPHLLLPHAIPWTFLVLLLDKGVVSINGVMPRAFAREAQRGGTSRGIWNHAASSTAAMRLSRVRPMALFTRRL